MEELSEFDRLNVEFLTKETGTQQETILIAMMIKKAKTFGNWLCLYHIATPNTELETKALAKLMELADSLSDSDAKKKKSANNVRRQRWETIFNDSPTDSVAEYAAAKRIIGLMKSEKVPKQGSSKP